MRIKKRILRCAYCRHEVTGTGMPHNGILYCSRSCRELGIDRLMRNLAGVYSPWYIVLAVLATLMTMAVSDRVLAHDPYTKWLQPNSTLSCCNGKKLNDQGIETGDCEPVSAKWERGNWWAKHRDYWVQIPDNKIIRERNPIPEKGHLCINQSGVLCFVPPFGGI